MYSISRRFRRNLLWLYLLLIIPALQHCKPFPVYSSGGANTNAPKGSNVPKAEKTVGVRGDIVTYANKYKGSKYTPAGKTPKTGFDCSGFTSYVMAHFNIAISPSAREQVKEGKAKSLKDAKPGDLVFFRRGPGEPIFHVSLVIYNDGKSLRVIHSTTSRGVVVEDILASTYWKPYIDSVRDVVSQ